MLLPCLGYFSHNSEMWSRIARVLADQLGRTHLIAGKYLLKVMHAFS